jgi:phosphoserine aminotransferase
MSRKFNFYAGPSTLPFEVLQELEADFLDYRGMGLSLVETSHRSSEYDEVHSSVLQGIKSLLNIGDEFAVVLMGGGATLQFSAVPMNLMGNFGHSDYVISGTWAKKALADAKLYSNPRVVWDGSDEAFTSLPDPASIQSGSDSAYLHITSNETINGVQWKDFPNSEAPLVADMSSDIFSRPLPMERFGLIYAGAQKNLAPAGVTMVIIRKELLDRAGDNIGAYLKYKTHADKDSLYNTPPVFPIWAMSRVIKWIEGKGGLEGIQKINAEKANLLYSVIDGTDGFYHCPVDPAVRSTMNVVFTMKNDELQAAFLKGAAERDMLGLKGHRAVGGCRASIYNAMPLEGVQALADYMQDFAEKNA